MSFPRYPKYKSSGVEWLGEVPEHWDVVQLKQFVDIQNGSDHKHVEQTDGYPVLGSGGAFAYASEYLYDGESVLLGRKGTIDKPLHVTGRFWTVDTMYWTKINPSASGRFTYYVALTIPFDYYSTNTALPSMTKGNLNSHLVSRPPLPEQTHIAAFLDAETAKIDELVAEQRRLMDLLKEKRQAVISHAVTKGLNPNASMKSSGIEWLGEVPEHWEVKPLKYSITKIEQGWSPQCASEPAAENEWGVLKVGCGNRDRFDPDEQKALPLEVAPLPNYEIKAGDILMSRGNTLELVGSATYVEQVRPRLLLCDLLYRFRAKPDRAVSEFLVLSLRSPNIRFQIERDATGTSASMKKIGQGTIREFVIALPPLDEQHAIINHIKIETTKIDTLTAEAQRAIDLLQERRTALISAAVTGQIDVRTN
jgi:type I restriction enzyme S subunit